MAKLCDYTDEKGNPAVGRGLVPLREEERGKRQFMNGESPSRFPKRKWARLPGFDYAARVPYSVTICSKDRRPTFYSSPLSADVIECLKEEAERTRFILLAYCLMPDHMHILAIPGTSNVSLSRFIGGFKSKSTRRAWQHGGDGQVWQDSFYEHIVRGNEHLHTVAEYIVANPVRKGLTAVVGEYEHAAIFYQNFPA